jgi:uncharacterized phage protein (TIGR02216 family)
MTFADAALAAARVAAALLAWPPEVFWAATPADLRNALGSDRDSDATADTAVLARLMEAFPDDQ